MTGAAATGLAVEDRLDLLELHARLARAIDSGDAACWAALFSPDGVLRTSRGTELRGRAELERFAAEWFEQHSGRYRHATWNHTFASAGAGAGDAGAGDAPDEVDGTCYAAVLRAGAGDVAIEFTSFYRDRFQRGPEGWLLRERDVRVDPRQPEGD